MADFKKFKQAVQQQLAALSKHDMFRVSASKDELWETYLSSFPEGSNPIFRERTEHDCQCCKQFIRAGGNAVSIVDGELSSIWDINIGGAYQVVADALSELVKSRPISDSFLHMERNLGTDYNRQLTVGGGIIQWDHFYFELPSKFVRSGADIGPALSTLRSGKDVFKRALTEITTESAEIVLELIAQKSLYRGDEHGAAVALFVTHKLAFSNLDSDISKELYCWATSAKIGGSARFRNTAIGSLLVDISDGVELDSAVKMFESKVAPTNYKRPTALITRSMIDRAQKEVIELGIESALQRRHAATDDITVNNVIFANRETKKAMSVFDSLSADAPVNLSHLSKVDEVDINTFITSIVPKAETIEVLLENSHSSNLMSLIAPVHADAKPIFKWDNNFSWAYNGEVADSIKERVKIAGGNVNGVLRCSLSWFNYDDLDIHVVEPQGTEICFNNPRSITSGRLDVDMNAGVARSRSAVENIVWADESSMIDGEYQLFIHNYSPRETIDVGFDVEVECRGITHNFHYAHKVQGNVGVAKFKFAKGKGVDIIESIPSSTSRKELWGISTQSFHKVSMVMNSPNHWDGEKTGNKHWFFILDGCSNDKPARGFFNEFLNEGLNDHRKVFEVLGSKMKAETSDNQLSGIGFSSTQRNHVFCRVSGAFSRTIKVTF